MQRRILVLPLAAMIIAALVTYKLTRKPQPPQWQSVEGVTLRSAPLFQLYDDKSKMLRLTRYLGRHKMLIVFFDPSAGADKNPQLELLKRDFDDVKKTGAYILAISAATPYANRKSIERGGRFPFSLLSDPTLEVHRAWGVLDERTLQPVEGVFVVDRAGVIRWSAVAPEQPIETETLVEELNRAP